MSQYPTPAEGDGFECRYCEAEGADRAGCVATVLVAPDGAKVGRVPYQQDPTEPGPCPDCGVHHGRIHHPGCVNERCPECAELLEFSGCACPWLGVFAP